MPILSWMYILRFYQRLNETSYNKWVFDYRAINEKHTKIFKRILKIHEYLMKNNNINDS